MVAPKPVVDAIATLRAERGPLAQRIDAIDVAINSLSRAYGLEGQVAAGSERVSPRRRRGRRGTKAKTRRAAPARTSRHEGEDPARGEIFMAISRAEHGLTISELRKATPKMGGVARSAHLQALKTAGKIQRAGNTWKAA